jgi:hypothetical protein
MKKYFADTRAHGKGVFGIIGEIWKNFGGWKEVLSSPYFLCSLLITGLGYNVWLYDTWWDLPLSILPNVLGFSLAGYAILLAVSNQSFQKLLVESKDEESGTAAFHSVHAEFVHFAFIQALALLLGVIARLIDFDPTWLLNLDSQNCITNSLAIANKVFSGIGFLLFAYSLTLAVSCVISVYVVIDLAQKALPKDEPPKEPR